MEFIPNSSAPNGSDLFHRLRVKILLLNHGTIGTNLWSTSVHDAMIDEERDENAVEIMCVRCDIVSDVKPFHSASQPM